MIPNDPESIKQLKALADRNIANGDWGDEITMPGDTIPAMPEKQIGKNILTKVLAKHGSVPAPKKRR